MQISSKVLLSSAQTIVRDRQKDGRTSDSQVTAADAGTNAAGADGLSQSAIEARLLNLQAALATVQRNYSREQARYSYLTELPEQVSSSLLFEGEPLFPEVAAGKNDVQDMKKHVGTALESLVRSLKSIEVEMENLYALNFTDVDPSVNMHRISEMPPVRQLDPGRVARLTRG